MLLF
ncbi:hypothetical protein VTH06DRAFT_4514 [Thermothelomyces fergusii]|jgi:hypothetical protein